MIRLLHIWPLLLAAVLFFIAIAFVGISTPEKPSPISNRARRLADSEAGLFLSMLYPVSYPVIALGAYFAFDPLSHIARATLDGIVADWIVETAVVLLLVGPALWLLTTIGRHSEQLARAVAEKRHKDRAK